MDSDEDDHDHQPAASSDGLAYAVDREPHNTAIRMKPKIPPTFDGQSSWFEFEDLIDDWLGITTLTAEKLGPSLKNALVGAAEFYKNEFQKSNMLTLGNLLNQLAWMFDCSLLLPLVALLH